MTHKNCSPLHFFLLRQIIEYNDFFSYGYYRALKNMTSLRRILWRDLTGNDNKVDNDSVRKHETPPFVENKWKTEPLHIV